MPIFSSPDHFKDLKGYVPLLKKALLAVKPDAQKKFLYYNQYPFGLKKLPLVLVDFDLNCAAALAKAGHRPTAEGQVSLTPQDELNFEAKKGTLKRIRIKKYFATLGGGFKVVFVPAGEVDDEDAALGSATPLAGLATQPQSLPSQTQPTEKKLPIWNNDTNQTQLLARIEQLRAKPFPPNIEAIKNSVFVKAKALGEANKLAEATLLLDQLSARAALPQVPSPTVADASLERKPADGVGALKWTRWFREIPVWPELLTKTAWDKNKSVLAKMTQSTGIGDQLKVCETAFQAASAKMPFLTGGRPEVIAKSIKDCQAFMADSTVQTLRDSLKTLRDIATKAATECQKSKLIPKATAQLCTDIANTANTLMVACNPNSLSGCIAEAVKANDATAKADKLWRIDELKVEKDLAKRIALCEALLEEHTDRSPQRDKVEDILAETKKQWGVDQAKAAYATQMKGEVHDGDAKTPAYNPGGQFELMNLKGKNLIFQDKKVQELMRSTGLTEGEVLAIRAYTAANYKYINPAIANQKDRTDKKSDWMDTQNRPDPSKATSPKQKQRLEAELKQYEEGLANEPGSKKSLYEEGALHAGMMAEAFKKLPKKTATLYRGARMNPKAYKAEYSKGKIIAYEAFVSQTTSEDVARNYARGGGDFTPPDDATTSVFVEALITDARDIMALSVYEAGEGELLLPPGTKLRVESIKDDTERDPGAPSAKEWKKVLLKQVLK